MSSSIKAGFCAHEESSIRTSRKGNKDAFNEQNKGSRRHWVYFTLASRNSDSDIASDLSAAGLHIEDPEGEVASAKTRITPTILNPQV